MSHLEEDEEDVADAVSAVVLCSCRGFVAIDVTVDGNIVPFDLVVDIGAVVC